MVADQTIGKRLSDGGLGQFGDPSRINIGGATGYYVDEQGMPLDIHQWPPQKPSVKAEYERPFKYDSEGRITETLTVLLPSTPNKDAKWLRRGFIRKRYVDPRAVGIDILPRFNQGQGERRPERLETLAEFHARREEQRIRAELERERWEAEHGADESEPDEPVEIELPEGMELEVPDEVAKLRALLEQAEREKAVAQKTLSDVLAAKDQAVKQFQASGPNPIAAGNDPKPLEPGYAGYETAAEHVPADPPSDDAVDPQLQVKRDRMAKAREAAAAKRAAKKAQTEAAA